MRRFFSEPLVHFLILGGLLFAAFQFTGTPEDETTASTDREIVITPGRIETLAANFTKVWQRPPTEPELNGLIEDFIKEEVFYREALAIGLDRDDTIIRRRLRQKMEFISTDISEQVEPTEAELAALLQADADAYRIDANLSFQQVFIDPTEHGELLDGALADLRVQLISAETTAEITALGDRLMMETAFENQPLGAIDRLFGQGFGAQLEPLALNEWAGPIRSGYGLHFVRVTDRSAGRLPTVDEVRSALIRDWRSDRASETAKSFFESLRSRYTITVQD